MIRSFGFPTPVLTVAFALTAAIMTISAQPSAAAGIFAPPAGCTLEITAQNRSCTVSQHYRCSADQAGDQRVTIFTPDGPVYESRIDVETRWMQSRNLLTGLADTLIEDSPDHASFSTLLNSGRDDFDFWTVSNTGERLHHVGHDILTGEKTEIGGVALEVTQFDLKTYSEAGDLLIHRQGSQFISRAHGRFYGGTEKSTDWTGNVTEDNDTPVRFSFPGQPGFGDTIPQYDCDMQMVRADEPLQLGANL